MSPGQVKGRLKAEGKNGISTSKIYSKIYRDKKDGGDLWLCLRRSRKTYRKGLDSKGVSMHEIKNRVSIEERTEIVEYRERRGDLEGDTMIGARHKGALLTMNDRVTKKVAISKLDSQYADHVCEKMIDATDKFLGKKYSCTVDNGREFAGHEDFTEATDIPLYFCAPRSPEQRGSNENTNGLNRQYLPKGADLSQVTPERIRRIEYELNSRPRKALGFLTPLEAELGNKVLYHFFD